MKHSSIRSWPLSIFLLSLALVLVCGCQRKEERTVVIYTSQDQVYAEPILQEFGRLTGVKVRAVYDSEAVKTVGLANRLLAERSHPQCDVFWNNEELRTRQLAAQGVFDELNGWVALGFRSRRIVINTNHLSLAAAPRSVAEFTDARWRGKVAIAYPMFGTTATHFLALRQFWGESKWKNWCRALQANKPFLVDGNSMVVKMVGRGEAWMGLTDSDDISAEQREGLPVVALPISDETLLIPNTVAVVRGAPHRPEALALFEYLQRPEVLEKLVREHALEGASSPLMAAPCLKVNWEALLGDLGEATTNLSEIFLR